MESIGADNIILVEAWDTNGDFSNPIVAFQHSVAIQGVTASYLYVKTDTGTFSTATKMNIFSVLESEETNIHII